MAKRRLSHQQRDRIQRNQQERIASAKDIHSDGPECRGRVYARYSRHVSVKPLDGESDSELIKCHLRANIDSITVGDLVAYSISPDGSYGVIVAVEDRRSVILRPDGLGKLKAVAANIDQVFIVIAEEPQAHPNLIDRYLVAAENANICAKIILNKCDIAISDENKALLDVYKALGYEVFYTSAESAQGLDEVKAALAGKTSIFAGQSGVGKSSLINTIMPELDLKVGRLSEHVVKGRHTTTSSSLFELINGGYLIDSPGIREFHLNHLERETIYRGYREFKDIQGQCHFRDCQHRQEPGCIYQEFIAAHGLSPTRLQSLNYILNNQDNL